MGIHRRFHGLSPGVYLFGTYSAHIFVFYFFNVFSFISPKSAASVTCIALGAYSYLVNIPAWHLFNTNTSFALLFLFYPSFCVSQPALFKVYIKLGHFSGLCIACERFGFSEAFVDGVSLLGGALCREAFYLHLLRVRVTIWRWWSFLGVGRLGGKVCF